jgi:RNA polymerase sigma factor (TIGR02999 family)
MSPTPGAELTRALAGAQAGDPHSAAELLPLVYAQLKELARARMAHQPAGHTLQPTALVHEAYLRVAEKGDVTWEGRRHFFWAAARAMRDILVEQARRRDRLKHGGGLKREELAEGVLVLEEPAEGVLRLHEALEELERQDPAKAQIVMLHCFTGLTLEETAEVLGQSERTLYRQWRFIRVWLKKRLA